MHWQRMRKWQFILVGPQVVLKFEWHRPYFTFVVVLQGHLVNFSVYTDEFYRYVWNICDTKDGRLQTTCEILHITKLQRLKGKLAAMSRQNGFWLAPGNHDACFIARKGRSSFEITGHYCYSMNEKVLLFVQEKSDAHQIFSWITKSSTATLHNVLA